MRQFVIALGVVSLLAATSGAQQSPTPPRVGQEKAIPQHLRDGDEFATPVLDLIRYGQRLFAANWTEQDGAGRPEATGAGRPLADRSQPLTGLRAFNRISGPDANSCQGCHNLPHGITGGGGDFVTNVFAGAERFDFVNFERDAAARGRGRADAAPLTLQTVGRLRATPGLSGAGYLELLARQMTADLQAIRDALKPGESRALATKGVSFGVLVRLPDGGWDTKRVQGLAAASIAATAGSAPSLVVRPWRQSGESASLRQFTIDSLNRSHGIQATERVGVGTDPDRDGIVDEITRADVTALVLFQATLPVPGQVIPRNPDVERAIVRGDRVFDDLSCSTCHVRSLPLRGGALFTEPGSNAVGAPATRRTVTIDLNDKSLPLPRLDAPSANGVVAVPAFTDMKLHDVSGTQERFLTRRLWGSANEPPYWHDGSLTTLRAAVLAHRGEAQASRDRFASLPTTEQDALIEFLKSLQVLPPGTPSRIVDEQFRPR